MSGSTVEQLAKFLGMMGSAHDGEVLNAARFAENLRKKMDKTWLQLLTNDNHGVSSVELSMWKMRALNAEVKLFKAGQRTSSLEARIADLEQQLSNLQTAMGKAANASAKSGGAKWVPSHGGRRFRGMTSSEEAFLVGALRHGWKTVAEVREITGWADTVDVGAALRRLAKRHGLTLEARTIQPRRYRLV